MAAPQFDLVGPYAVDIGSKFDFTFQFKNTDGTPRDFTGKLFRGWVKKQFDDPAAYLTFTFNAADNTGEVKPHLGATATAGKEKGKYYYDIEVYSTGDSNDVERLIKGRLELTNEVTTG